MRLQTAIGSSLQDWDSLFWTVGKENGSEDIEEVIKQPEVAKNQF